MLMWLYGVSKLPSYRFTTMQWIFKHKNVNVIHENILAWQPQANTITALKTHGLNQTLWVADHNYNTEISCIQYWLVVLLYI